MALHTISLFSGVSMLDEGLRAGLAHMGIPHRTLCHVEREAYGASVLAARMEEGSLDAAPVWSDVSTFDARAWHGKVDCIVAGFPCQDLSIAGRRAGLDGARSGLFFEVLRIADDSGAWCIFLENVAGIATATAAVMDEAEGALEERAVARVVGELADRGWYAEWVPLSASDVGASHGRARWFCWAWRVGHTGLQHQHLQQREDGSEHSGTGQPVAHSQCAKRGPIGVCGTGCRQRHDAGWRETHGGFGVADQVLGDTHQQRQQQPDDANCTEPWHQPRAGACGSGGELAHAEFHGCGALRPGEQRWRADSLAGCSEQLANPESDGRNQGRTESGWEQGRPDATERDCAMANPGCRCHRAHESQPITRCSDLPNDCAGGSAMADARCARRQGDQLCRSHEQDGRTDGRTDGAGIMPTNYRISS